MCSISWIRLQWLSVHSVHSMQSGMHVVSKPKSIVLLLTWYWSFYRNWTVRQLAKHGISKTMQEQDTQPWWKYILKLMTCWLQIMDWSTIKLPLQQETMFRSNWTRDLQMMVLSMREMHDRTILPNKRGLFDRFSNGKICECTKFSECILDLEPSRCVSFGYCIVVFQVRQLWT